MCNDGPLFNIIMAGLLQHLVKTQHKMIHLGIWCMEEGGSDTWTPAAKRTLHKTHIQGKHKMLLFPREKPGWEAWECPGMFRWL